MEHIFYKTLFQRPIRLPGIRFFLWHGCLLAVGTTYFLTQSYSPLFQMISIIGTLFLFMKIIVLTEWKIDNRPFPSFFKLLCFLFLWPGMNPAPFATSAKLFTGFDRFSMPQTLSLFRIGFLQLISASILLLFIASFPPTSFLSFFLHSFTLFIALSLMVHFGLFTLLTSFFRAFGIRVTLPFKNPLKASSLNTFWNRYWNRPYMEMVSLSIFRPLQNYFPANVSLFLGFLLSGLFHEVAITLPAGSGYGGPSLYFILHGILVLLERRKPSHMHPLFKKIFLWVFLILPLPLLFPPAFVFKIIWPLINL